MKMDETTRALVYSTIITVFIISLGYARKTPLTFFEFTLIYIFLYFSYRILFVLRGIKRVE